MPGREPGRTDPRASRPRAARPRADRRRGNHAPRQARSRAIWTGAVSFGLVHVPVSLYPAASEGGIDFDWLDRRTMDPVGYKRINKRTGREVPPANIVRGVKVDDGRYVVMSDEEIRAAYPRSTQTIEIEAFVEPARVPFTLLQKPYYLEPLPHAEKVYALLREALRAAGVVGLARMVIHVKEHLCVLVPAGPALMLDTLRWASELRPWDALKLPPEDKREAKLNEAELKMATRLVAEMTVDWQPERYEDRFSHAVHELVRRRARAGKTEAVQPLEEPPAATSENVVDLTELLRKSLGGRAKDSAARAPTQASLPALRNATRRRTAARRHA